MYTIELYKKDPQADSGERLEHKVYGLGRGLIHEQMEINYSQQYPAPKWRVEVVEACECYGCTTMRHACINDTVSS